MQSVSSGIKRLYAGQIWTGCCLIIALLSNNTLLGQDIKSYSEYLFSISVSESDSLSSEFIELNSYLAFLDVNYEDSFERDRLKTEALSSYQYRKEEFLEKCEDLTGYLLSWKEEEGIILINSEHSKQSDRSHWVCWTIQGMESQEIERFYFQLIPTSSDWKLIDGFYTGGIPN